MRIYELAKQLNVPAKELVEFLNKQGISAKSHMSAIDQNAVQLVEKKYKKGATSAPVQPSQERKEPMQTESMTSRTSERKPVQQTTPPKKIIPQSHPKKVHVEPKAPTLITLEPMLVSDVATALAKPVNEVILTLLKWKVIAAKNKLLPEETVERLAQHYEIPTVKKRVSLHEEESLVRDGGTGKLKERLPVVVVLGHVDHGKTTLLDFIRNTRVVAREKGGITQHLGAYEASTKQGNLVFLDTPGHEAFPKMRQRGIKVADIGVLVVAADDGIMPQTIEAIKQLKKMDVPIIVAINKIDKADPVRVEVAKRQLAEQDLLPEEWGGQTICMPISALTGQGVDDLLEMIALQAQMLELKASQEGFARGYVLESRLERGRGPVATLICQHGTLKVGDYFVCGKTTGRVSSIKNSAGTAIMKAGPSIPVQVAGFKELPDAGDLFKAMTKDEVRKERYDERSTSSTMRATQEEAINLVIKVDTNSSKEALLDAIHKLSSKSEIGFNVVYAGVGNISEGDVELAFSTNSDIIALHTKSESNALALAQQRGVSIQLFDVIYKLLEMLEERAEKEKKVEMERVKIGTAVVRRVFDIKGIGVVAGSYVQDGRFTRDGIVMAWRGNEKIGEGKITSLQRDKKTVKEVHSGFECGFVVDGVTDWQEDDRAECYIEVPKK